MSNTPRSFRLPVELWAAVDVAAAGLGQSKTVFVRRALEEALGGSRVGTSGQGECFPKGPVLLPAAPAPSPRASVAKVDYRDVLARDIAYRQAGKRAGGFVPRPKRGS